MSRQDKFISMEIRSAFFARRRGEPGAVLNEWKTGGIGGWLEGDSPWFTMAETLAARVAKLVGAERR